MREHVTENLIALFFAFSFCIVRSVAQSAPTRAYTPSCYTGVNACVIVASESVICA